MWQGEIIILEGIKRPGEYFHDAQGRCPDGDAEYMRSQAMVIDKMITAKLLHVHFVRKSSIRSGSASSGQLMLEPQK
jgi:hypothetical protein